MKFLKATFLILFFFSCQGNIIEQGNSLEQEIKALTTTELQRQFLEKIGELDQKVRHDETKANQEYGYDSKEHKASWDKIMQVDLENLDKIELYLETYGHPSLAVHGKSAAGAPWIVIHHASDGIAPRFRNFKHLYWAYRNKDIDDSVFSLYLNRWYRIQYRESIRWNRPFRIEEELDTLYKSLDLEEMVKELDKEFMLE